MAPLPGRHIQHGRPGRAHQASICLKTRPEESAQSAVTPENAEMAQAGDAVWQRAERRGLAHGSAGRSTRLIVTTSSST
jgi:hypothetical protein